MKNIKNFKNAIKTLFYGERISILLFYGLITDFEFGYEGSAEVLQGNCPNPRCSRGSGDCTGAPGIPEFDHGDWLLEGLSGE